MSWLYLLWCFARLIRVRWECKASGLKYSLKLLVSKIPEEDFVRSSAVNAYLDGPTVYGKESRIRIG